MLFSSMRLVGINDTSNAIGFEGFEHMVARILMANDFVNAMVELINDATAICCQCDGWSMVSNAVADATGVNAMVGEFRL